MRETPELVPLLDPVWFGSQGHCIDGRPTLAGVRAVDIVHLCDRLVFGATIPLFVRFLRQSGPLTAAEAR